MIKYYDRNKKTYEVEKVAGKRYLDWTYNSPIGRSFLKAVIKRRLFSKFYGKYCDTNFSKNKISKFVKEFDIDLSQSKHKIEEFTSFNDFFVRELTEAARPIDFSEAVLVSPGDGKLLAFDTIDLKRLVQVKGITYSLKELIQEEAIASRYDKGCCLILRLCPTDYHRFHFLDSGTCDETNFIKGQYYSVNPVALSKIPKLFCQNKRAWSIFHSDNFGDVLYIEVGATCVGTIIETYTPNTRVKKGGEKGYFKFGGSTVVLFFEPDKIKIHEEIMKHSAEGIETAVLFGETIGEKYK